MSLQSITPATTGPSSVTRPRAPSDSTVVDQSTQPAQSSSRPSTGGMKEANEKSGLSGGAGLALTVTPAVDTEYLPEWEVSWDGPDDQNNPYNWSPFKRWYIVLLGALLVLNATFASSAPSETITAYIEEWDITELVGTLTVSLFVAGYCAGPLAWGPLSESYGRRNIFLISFGPYIGWCIGCALSKNIASLLVFRFLAGAFAAAPLANSGALVADLLPAATRGLGLAIFSLAPFAGPSLGPTVGGFIQATGTSWRVVYWVMVGFAGACYILLIFTLPETYTPLLLQRKARKLRKETGDNRYWAPLDKKKTGTKAMLYNCLVRPFKMLIQEPMLLIITLYTSFIYGVIYLQFGSLPYIFSGVHGFTAGITGLCFLPIFIGGAIGNLTYIFYFAKKYTKAIAFHHPNPVPPEERLGQAMIAAVILPISMFWLGWTGNYASISYWSPLLAIGFLGMSVLMAFMALFNYMIDTYLAQAATALAVNTVVRSSFGAGFPLFAPTMFNKLGINWACTVLACIALAGMPIPFIFYRMGPRIRAMSKNAAKVPPSNSKAPPRDVEEEVGDSSAAEQREEEKHSKEARSE